jgi:thioredoxin reductase (NADPH)
MKKEKVIIIGGGPAGLAAAVYNARAGLNPLVFGGSPPGGQLSLTSEVENFPGFSSILGSELIEKMREQAKKFGARIIDQNITKVDFSTSVLKLETSKEVYQAKAVLIATGAKALWLGLDSEKRLRGKGISACATCDGFFFKNKNVAVIGGGDTALEEASTLAKFASKVYIIHRRDSFRGSKVMQERVLSNNKIEVIFNSQVEEILGDKRVESIRIRNAQSAIKKLPVDGVFIAIGHKPDTELFQGQIELDKKGYVVTDKKSMTSVSGVFAAGDCVDHVYRQAATAAGMGVAAALDVERFINY